MDYFNNQYNGYNETTQSPQTDDITIEPEKAEKMRQAYEYYKQQNHNADYKPDKSGSLWKVLVIALIALIFAFGIYCIASDIMSGAINNSNNANVVLTTESKPELEDEYIDNTGRYTPEGIAKLVRPSIVEIIANTEIDGEASESGGSGIILFKEGYIVTNAHVIENAKQILVVLSDDRSFPAEIIGRDSKSDIAIIKIEADQLATATLGDSDEVMLGEQVMAIGNPGGLAGSITGGYVSGLNRQIRGGSSGFKMNCIQTDAAISPGNSGGALVNMYGQVIGITSSKYVSSSYEGLGFAITINDAIPIIKELISQGYISGRVKIGITFNQIDEKNAELYNLPMGIRIETIDENCDISNTELQKGDIITHIEETEIDSYDAILDILNASVAGDILHADVVRLDDDGNVIKEFEIEFELMADTEGIY